MKWQEIILKLKKKKKYIYNNKNLIDNQHCDASESVANFGVYIGNQKTFKIKSFEKIRFYLKF